MKKLHKKGFTIVELVIVIAVIAILAAVLIPTFVNVTKRAKLSVDQQAVYEMNIVLAADEAKNGAPADVSEVLLVLEEEGISAKNYTPLTSGLSFVWAEDVNRILLVDENGVVYPEDYIGVSQAEYWHDLATAAIDSAEKALDEQLLAENYTVRIGETGYPELTEAIGAAKAGDEVRLLAHCTTDSKIEIEGKSDFTLDLNGYTIGALNGREFYGITVSECDNVTFENGNISLNNASTLSTAVEIKSSTNVKLSHLYISAVTSEGTSVEAAVSISSGTVEISDCTLVGQVAAYNTPKNSDSANKIIIVNTDIYSSAPISLSIYDTLTVRGGSLIGATGFFVGNTATNVTVSLEGDIELVPAADRTVSLYIFSSNISKYSPTVSAEIYERYLKNGTFAITSSTSITYNAEKQADGTYIVVRGS